MKILAKLTVVIGVVVMSLYCSYCFKESKKEMKQSSIPTSPSGVITEDMVEYIQFETDVQEFIKECKRQGLTGDIYVCDGDSCIEDSSKYFILETFDGEMYIGTIDSDNNIKVQKGE